MAHIIEKSKIENTKSIFQKHTRTIDITDNESKYIQLHQDNDSTRDIILIEKANLPQLIAHLQTLVKE